MTTNPDDIDTNDVATIIEKVEALAAERDEAREEAKHLRRCLDVLTQPGIVGAPSPDLDPESDNPAVRIRAGYLRVAFWTFAAMAAEHPAPNYLAFTYGPLSSMPPDLDPSPIDFQGYRLEIAAVKPDGVSPSVRADALQADVERLTAEVARLNELVAGYQSDLLSSPPVNHCPEKIDLHPMNGRPALPDILALSRLVLRLGQVNRVTLDANGNQESDTTHSLMLALLAGSLCGMETVELCREDVVALALIHDIAEAYAGDTSTVRTLSVSAANEKAAREEAALVRIREELAGMTWVLALIDRYERQACPESRWVRYLDKITPKLTHRDNGCAVPRSLGMTLNEAVERHAYQGAELAARYPGFTFLRGLFAACCEDAESQWGVERS